MNLGQPGADPFLQNAPVSVAESLQFHSNRPGFRTFFICSMEHRDDRGIAKLAANSIGKSDFEDALEARSGGRSVS